MFWATFVSKFVTQNFQKSPNLVTMVASVISDQSYQYFKLQKI